MTRQFSAACCLGVLVGVGRCADPQPPGARSSPRADDFRHYVDDFNPMVPEEVVNAVPNAQSWGWLEANVPFFACPDRALEQTYYYRWWALRKHIKRTPKGWVFTEFLRPVRHGTEYNAISCALGHHILEGRWIRDRQYVEQYVRFWLQSGENGGLQKDYHKYSSWTAAAVYEAWLVHQDRKAVVSLLDSLVLDFHTWEMERVLENWLFWQIDVRDGMEESVSGSRRDKNARPTINSYMYGNARAIAAVARLRGDAAVAREFEAKAERLKRLVLDRLWDAKTRFFKPLREGGGLADVRELIGYTPWYFHLPDADRGYEAAWVDRAKDMLATTVLTVAEVAEHAGFASVHYLSRVFREATGQTPTAFRRQVQNPVGVGGTSSLSPGLVMAGTRS
jgi:hypothetical protein